MQLKSYKEERGNKKEVTYAIKEFKQERGNVIKELKQKSYKQERGNVCN